MAEPRTFNLTIEDVDRLFAEKAAPSPAEPSAPAVPSVAIPSGLTPEMVDRLFRETPAPAKTEASDPTSFLADPAGWFTQIRPPRRTEWPWEEAIEPFLKPFESSDAGYLSRALSAAAAPFEATGRLAEQALEQAPRLLGAPAQSSPLSRVGGTVAEFAAPVGGYAKAATALGTGATRAAAAAGKPVLRNLRIVAGQLKPAVQPLQPAVEAWQRWAGPRLATKALTNITDSAVGKAMKAGYGSLFSTIYSRLEDVGGPLGRTLARLDERKWEETTGWVARHILPLYRQAKKLSSVEKENFIEVAEKGATPLTTQVANLYTDYQKIFGPGGVVLTDAAAVGVKITPRPSFFPHEFDPSLVAQLRSDPAFVVKMTNRLMTKGYSRLQALKTIAQIRRKVGKDRKTGAEFSREVDLPDYIRDPAVAILRRGEALAQRFAEMKIFGPKDANVQALIKAVQKTSPVKAQQLSTLFGYLVARDPLEHGLGTFFRAGMAFQAYTKLPLAFAVNLFQNMQGATRVGWGHTALAYMRYFAKLGQSHKEARELGLTLDMTTRRLALELTGRRGGLFQQTALSTFNFSEHVVRAVAYEQGTVWANHMQRMLNSLGPKTGGKTVGWLQREFDRLLFAPDEVKRLLVTRRLMPRDVERVKRAISDQIAFIPRAGRRSAFYQSSSWGPMLLQFKSFLSNSSRLIKQQVLDEARAGNWSPFFHWTGLVLPSLMVAGEVPADLRAALRGGKRAAPVTGENIALRALDNVASIGSLSLAIEMMMQATGLTAYGGGVGGLTRFVAGPTLSDLDELLARLGGLGRAAATGEGKETTRQAYELGRYATRRIPLFPFPLVGPYLANVEMRSTAHPKVFRNEDVLDRLGISARAMKLARLREQQRRQRRESMYERIGE